MMPETDLTLSCGGLPPWSSRNCTQELQPIATGELRRTVNGELLYTGLKSYEKYWSLIKCRDRAPLAFDSLWCGQEMTVGCIQRLWQPISGKSCVLARDYVQDSIVMTDEKGQPLKVQNQDARKLEWEGSIERGFISYCPLLKTRVVSFGYDTDEWELEVSWFLKVEEI